MPLKTPNYLEEQTYSPEDRPTIEYSTPPMATDTAGINMGGVQPDLDMISPVPGGAPAEPVLTPAIPRPAPQPIPGAVPQPMQPQVAQPPPEDTLVGLRKQLLDFERIAAEPRPKKLRPVPLGLSALMLAVDAYTGKPRWLNMLLFDRPAEQRKLDTQYKMQLHNWHRKKPLYDTHKAILDARVRQADDKIRITDEASARRTYMSAKVGLEGIKEARKVASTQYASAVAEANNTYYKNLQDGADPEMSARKAELARDKAANDYNVAMDRIGHIDEAKYRRLLGISVEKLKALGIDFTTIDAELMPDINRLPPSGGMPGGGAGMEQEDDYSTASDDELISALNRELSSEVA